jgi:COP9 signalosome complex subunit 3
MIRDGHIKATLPQSGAADDANTTSVPVLRFLSHDPLHVPVGLNQDAVLKAKFQQIDRLSQHVKEADRKLAISKDYIEFVRRSKRAEGAGAPGYEDPMEEGWDVPNADADEDMMADLH